MVVTFGQQNTQKTFSTSSPAATVGGLPNLSVPAAATTQPPAAAPFGTFGAAPSTAAAPATSSFGAPAAGGLFGAAPSSTQPFGAPAGAPTSTGLFPSAPGGGLFGSAPAPATGGGLFGKPPAPASTGFFGSQSPAPATGGGLFGSGAFSTFGATTGSTFGNPKPGGGFFGSPAPTGPQQQPPQVFQGRDAVSILYNAEDRQFQDEATKLLQQVGAAYSQNMDAPNRTESAPFTTTLYNPASADYIQKVWLTVGQTGNAHAKPMLPSQARQMSEQDWAFACATAPEHYEPITCVGASGLVTRINQQQVTAQLVSSQVKELLNIMESLKQRQEEALRKGHDAKLYRLRTDRRGRLWRIMQKLEVCRAYQQPYKEEESRASAHLDVLRKYTEAASLVQLPAVGDAVAQEFPPFVTPNGEHPIDPAIVRARLVEHRQLLVELIQFTKKDLRDIKLLVERFQQEVAF